MLRGLSEWGNRHGFFSPGLPSGSLQKDSRVQCEVCRRCTVAALLLPAFPHKAPSPTDEPQQQKALHYCCTEEKGREGFKQPALCLSSLKNSGVIKFRAAPDSCPVTYSCWPPLFITFLRTMRASSRGVTTTIDRYEPTIIRFLQKNQMALQ